MTFCGSSHHRTSTHSICRVDSTGHLLFGGLNNSIRVNHSNVPAVVMSASSIRSTTARKGALLNPTTASIVIHKGGRP